jgi:PAS domain S-box-containing protein
MILVVDDEPESRTLLTAILIGEGYRVRTADGGVIALASIRVRQPELILLDIQMPGMDGFEICRRIKEDEDTRHIPLMFLSARGQLAERVEGFRLGAVDFIVKPFQREELLARVRTHVELGRLRSSLEEQVAERTAKLRESEERFRTIADAAPVMIWVAGTDKSCTFVNRPWLEFTGRQTEQELGNGWTENIHPNDLPECVAAYTAAFDARRIFNVEYRKRRADGEYRWVVGCGVPQFSAAGDFEGYVGSCTDITERKAAAEQLRALSAFLIAAQEEERRRISRELHDDLVQRLCLIAIDLGKLVSGDRMLPKVREAVGFLQQRTVQAAELTRHIAHELHPTTLEDLGLATALRSLCEEVAEREEIEIDFHSDEAPHTIKRETASCIYAVVQEALQNISKHAQAQTVRVRLAGSSSSVGLLIADDGVGFRPQPGGGGLGLGIVNMRERVRWLNGSFTLESHPGHGTSILVQIPTSGATHETRADSAGR